MKKSNRFSKRLASYTSNIIIYTDYDNNISYSLYIPI